ncbi:type VI secretion system baseplate subunit TssK [Pigmentibacter ruber]|uniref:type VI secretion system baseplate subunit TssK n=1 Tax=Pigmentibacter ruber TaxID=2683196 RepID=UPI00131A86A1|nr:type VI secretion system baseplate subunit TssK [Pigmentibacter ruber]
MLNEKITFENIPRQILWDEGMIIHPTMLYYEFHRLEITNAKRFMSKNSNSYGIKKLDIDNSKIINDVYKINDIECIFPDGTIYKKNKSKELSIKIEHKDSSNDELYIFIAISEYSSKNFSIDNEDSRYCTSLQQSIIENNTNEIHFHTIEENVFLYINSYPPVNCSYIPLFKFKCLEGNIEKQNFIPPSLTVYSDSKLEQTAITIIEFMKKKFEIIKQDIEFIKNSENILSFIEKNNLISNLKQAINNLQTFLSIKSCTPELFYNECALALSLISNYNILNINLSEYNHLNLNFIFENIVSKIEHILNQEISEKYRTYRFNKKDNIFYINLNYTLPETLKISVKKPVAIKEEEILEWVRTALICEKADMDFNIEKRSVGFDRTQDLLNPEIVVKNDFLLFTINISNVEHKNDNVIIIKQNNNNLNKFEPDEIYLYQEKVT